MKLFQLHFKFNYTFSVYYFGTTAVYLSWQQAWLSINLHNILTLSLSDLKCMSCYHFWNMFLAEV